MVVGGLTTHLAQCNVVEIARLLIRYQSTHDYLIIVVALNHLL